MSIEIKKGGGNISPKMEERMNRQEGLIYAVVLVVVIMVVQLLVDSFRFSSITYKEYSEKLSSVEVTQKINKQLLEQNVNNQKIIIDLQKQILNKK